ncbi:hypothetical protein [Hymenobacter sp. CRA2]|uniref:hypothetical protein n=1 Tax=Hymenobacter sp. CRA2 TaxID=1955620 RepID=UPI00098F4133|nr:hypothetical protein [Hymenobacter sp. CRA2]OON67181.1 hypothetical protein B0919_18815 [Hymenobacter sp. CRA2]
MLRHLQFTQRTLLTRTHLELTADGLRCEQRGLRSLHEFTLPYRELLPVRVARHREYPVLPTALALFILLPFLKVVYEAATATGPAAERVAWLPLALVGALVLLLAGHALSRWQQQFIIHTGRGTVVLTDRAQDREQLRAFAEALEAHTIAFLRQQYAYVDTYLPREPQLERLRWLRTHGVITAAELEHFRQKLFGSSSSLVGPVGFSLN